MEKRKRGRPQKTDQIKMRHPADRLRSLRDEMNTAIEFLLAEEDHIYELYPRDDEDTRMAMQQLSSRADSLMVILLNLKVYLALRHRDPTKLL